MNETSNAFLTALKAALQGKKAELSRELLPEQWQELFEMAYIHRVLPLIFQAVYAVPSLREQNAALAAAVRRQAMGEIMTQTRKTNDFLALNRQLQAEGVRPLVVKGIICRNLYPQPDCRPSGDEDVLIPAAQFEKCHQVLRAFGMDTTVEGDSLKNAYEVPYRMAESPLYIELHRYLFPPESEAYGDLNRFFEGARERAVPEEIQGNVVYTMGYTDHLFYLICHAFKHFLHSGFGIRQVCDIILYANRYGANIDWAQVLENCREIRADKFTAALFQIGSKYLGFDPDRAAYPQAWRAITVDETPMLEDLISGGLYGDAKMSRKHSSNITLAAVTSQKQGGKGKKGVLASAFPPAKKLEQRYPYLKDRPYLVPLAWGDRLLTYARETRRTKDNTVTDALKIGSERVGLMKEYGILK